ncbi:hypothetical protein AMTR_s00008p00247560 [Amborella trichopoda]|uniref:Uncharacterized protein n=1 Tax=Amborella trichopoda TaxID=13333 RepID=W1NI17_AMBTC|nr:hypothetical protein AMTR_s00008p00247560 [Amborella trichopoda]
MDKHFFAGSTCDVQINVTDQVTDEVTRNSVCDGSVNGVEQQKLSPMMLDDDAKSESHVTLTLEDFQTSQPEYIKEGEDNKVRLQRFSQTKKPNEEYVEAAYEQEMSLVQCDISSIFKVKEPTSFDEENRIAEW